MDLGHSLKVALSAIAASLVRTATLLAASGAVRRARGFPRVMSPSVPGIDRRSLVSRLVLAVMHL